MIGTVEQVAIGHYTPRRRRTALGRRHRTGGRVDGDGRPSRMLLDAEDELGRTLHAERTAVNSLIWTVYDEVHHLCCTTDWRFDGQRAAGEEWVCVPKPMVRRMPRGAVARPYSG